MADNKTPEEKLLRLIENPHPDLKDRTTKPFLRKFRFNLLSFKGLKAKIQEIAASKEKLKPYLLNLKFVNRCLTALSLILIVYLILDFINSRPTLSHVYANAKEISAQRPRVKISLETKAADISEYLTAINNRDMFHFGPGKKEEKTPQAKEILNTAAKNMKLVGIIWSRTPQVMIEDKQENKTLLLNEQDTIGNIKIKQILRDRVILGYENEELELM